MKDPDQDVLDAVEMVGLCQAMTCLPRAGGLLDQDARDVWIMKHVLNAQAERMALDEKRGGSGDGP